MHIDANAAALAERGVLEASIRVPDAAGDIAIHYDLRVRRVTTSVSVEAPGEGRPVTQVHWLVRQLKDAPDGLVVEASFVNTKTTTASVLNPVRERAQALLLANDPKRPPTNL